MNYVNKSGILTQTLILKEVWRHSSNPKIIKNSKIVKRNHPVHVNKYCGEDHWDQEHNESNSKSQNNQNKSSKDKPFIAAMAYLEKDNYKRPETNCQRLKKESTWLLDTGASNHLTGNLALIHNRIKTHSRIETANGTIISTIKGSVTLYLDKGKVLFKDVHFLPGLNTNILSGSRFLKAGGASLNFTENYATIKFRNEQKTIPATNDLTFNITESHALKAHSSSRTMEEWHSAF